MVEAEIHRLVDVSGVIGWDRHAADELAECARLLAQSEGDIGEAVSIAAVSIVPALREVLLGGVHEGPSADAGFETLAAAITKAVLWMRCRPDYEDLKAGVLKEIEEGLKPDDGELDFVPQLFEQAETALDEEGGSAEALAAPSPLLDG